VTTPIIDTNRFRREVQLVCNVSSDVQTFWASFRVVLDRNIEFAGCSWFTFDPATMLPTSHTAFRSFPPEEHPHTRFLEHEATADDVGRFVTLGRDRPYVALLSDLTGGKLETSARYREFLEPNGFEHELRIAFVHEGVCWGGGALYRKKGEPNFIAPEVKALAGVVEFLGESMHRALLTSSLNREEDGSRAPGVIVLGPANRVDLISPPAQEWLTGLGVELGDAWSTVLPGEVYAIASHARRTGAGHFDAGPAVSQTGTAGGGKVELHAALMEGEPQGPVAVMVEPVAPPRVAAEILSAYGLSDEEGEVLRTVLTARPTEGLDDRVASLVAKVGVADRQALAAKVYADHYAFRLTKSRPVGPDGWFEAFSEAQVAAEAAAEAEAAAAAEAKAAAKAAENGAAGNGAAGNGAAENGAAGGGGAGADG
jgi:hypothetical protein